MNNLVQYLWQAVESHNSIRVVDTIIKDKQTIHWYFYSEKQGKILRKKQQNSSPAVIIDQYEKKCDSRFDKLEIGFKITFEPFLRKIISGSELIDLMYDDAESFIFSNLSTLSNPQLFVLTIRQNQKITKPYSKKYEYLPQYTNKIQIFITKLQSLISTITLRKSQKILDSQIIIAISKDQVYLVYADIFKIDNDYFHLSYQHHNTQEQTIKKVKKLSQQLFFCQTCDRQIQKQDRKQINYEGILVIKTIKKKSKYGLNPSTLYSVCHKCYNLLFTKAE